ncbi:MAG: 7,8-didemethyl-8-hydroxy-5-deazariboflavin synthase subunit CofG [Archaeoglobaceae archaeon]|nr:7,8-didemethyl-8-hydroxy-5-deazariboflavin synthase subunit CofG [Archaeoglobaceae archaeon]MCX8151957.1 7,8-didemethyl-8-hydroxy-5-deazariboflavin synthase subunit CofG [Archaeoglobaceae archaeon]MDW8013346.1 7,8-didemethyl-8-hydroxy-5-deazariboflavin synthase subunit CofG [Archaeoglobaceae archaeon]
MIVTYSRNVFVPLTRNCRNRCAYCCFRTDELNLMKPEEVEKLLRTARNAKEALFTFGEKPDLRDDFKKELRKLGYKNFLDYIVDMNFLAIKNGLLPHTNAGVLSKEELKKLKPFNASMGLMLEQAVELECHAESPGKRPELRINTIRCAGKLQIPFTTGILIGIGEKTYDREYSIEVILEIHKNYGHIQEVIIQNFMPKKGTKMENWKPVSEEEMVDVVKFARKILPKDVAIQVPPNLVKDLEIFLRAGANDVGGISDVTPDYINPEAPWPSIDLIVSKLKDFVFMERLPIYPKFVKLKWYSEIVGGLIEKYSNADGYARSL